MQREMTEPDTLYAVSEKTLLLRTEKDVKSYGKGRIQHRKGEHILCDV